MFRLTLGMTSSHLGDGLWCMVNQYTFIGNNESSCFMKLGE